MDKILQTLRAEYPGINFDGGDRSEGFWIRVDSPEWGWEWERNRMTSTEAIIHTVREAIGLRTSNGG
jgi:hypothetical protein